MECCDPLAIAVNVTAAFLAEGNDFDTDWLDVSIFRLLSGGGWMVTVKRTGIILDHELDKVAA